MRMAEIPRGRTKHKRTSPLEKSIFSKIGRKKRNQQVTLKGGTLYHRNQEQSSSGKRVRLLEITRCVQVGTVMTTRQKWLRAGERSAPSCAL